MLTVRGLRKSFPDHPPRVLIADLDLDLAEGEFVAIMGESGAGKSTLLNLIAGLERADAGSIVFDGVELTRMTDDQRSIHRRTHLGFIFQAFHLLPYLDLASNVALPLLLDNCPYQDAQQRARGMLDRVGLGNRSGAKPRDLSGGEMQRVAIARALVHRPRLILADEPTGNLDAANAREAMALLRDSAARDRTACMLVTHSQLAAQGADRVYVLGSGGLHERECS